MKTSQNPTSTPIASKPAGFFEEVQEEIRQRAYELYEARGRGEVTIWKTGSKRKLRSLNTKRAVAA